MKTIIANPPWEVDGYPNRTNTRWPFVRHDGKVLPIPIYLAYAAAVLLQDGRDVEIIDAIMEDLDVEGFLRRVEAARADVLVLETTTPSIHDDLRTARLAKERLGLKIVLMGPHATSFHEDMAKSGFVDAVVRGEYDYTLRDIVKAYSEGRGLDGIAGATHMKDGRVVVEPDRELIADLDALPLPARHLLKDLELYDRFPARKRKNMTIIGGRGCPNRCTYCLWPQTLYGRKARARSAVSIVDEIQQLQEKYGVEEVFFDDDVFALSKARIMEFCDELEKRKMRVFWQCFGHASIADVDMYRRMRDSGCYIIRFGVESGCQELLDHVHKKLSLDQIRNAFALAKKAGLGTFGSMMFGFPGESADTVRRSLDFAIELDPDFMQFSIMTPFPGTELFAELDAKGCLLTKDWSKYVGGSNAIVSYPDFPKEEIERAIATAWRRFYLRPRMVMRVLGRMSSLTDLGNALTGLKTILRGHF